MVLGSAKDDEQACYEVCDAKGISLIVPIKVKDNTPADRRERAALYHDAEVREVFALRKILGSAKDGAISGALEGSFWS